ncbi:MAG TPA: class I SAM-dependent methyltransferase [Gemmatimonadales bacterium]|nr:class I SAM-dependent methyltransferase [Gemmatimonadales bacterium]
MLRRILKGLATSRALIDADEALRHARELANESRHGEAIARLDHLLSARPDCVDGLVLRASIKRAIRQLAGAAEDVGRAMELAPDDPRCVFELAFVTYLQGDRRLALEYCERLRQASPGDERACTLHAHIQLGGDHYHQLLVRILDFVKPRTYVEIGVDAGDSLRLVEPPALAIGIDPEPRLTHPLRANQKVFAMRSDAFFASHDLRAELGGLPVDLAFIDGMHHFEYALRDFAHLERYCARDSTILIHDCFPLDRETAERDRRYTFWSGDIWRLIVLLRKHRPDLAVHTIGAPPTGLGLVRNLDPGSRVLLEHYDQLCKELLSLDYSYLDADKAGKLNLFPGEWEKVRTLISS